MDGAMLPGEEEPDQKKKKPARPQWTHVRTLTADVLKRVIEVENEKRVAKMEEERGLVKDKILARSKLYQLLGGIKGITVSLNYDVPTYKDADVGVKAASDDDFIISGQLDEFLKLPPDVKKKLTKANEVSVDIKEAAQTLAAYIIVDLEKNPGADLLEIISKHVSDWVKDK